ncbi:MAG: hypothetical protein PVH12_07355 [Candidatus Bathyarchaeota archaeon]|jgi:hypothetical protein
MHKNLAGIQCENRYFRYKLKNNNTYLWVQQFDIMRHMSFRDYLHEKAEESRHNETLAYLIFLVGTVFFVGGLLESLSLTQVPKWFVFIPYHTQPLAGAVLGLAMIISGLTLIIFGIATGLNYSHDRSWYIQELRKASLLEKKSLAQEKIVKKSG